MGLHIVQTFTRQRSIKNKQEKLAAQATLYTFYFYNQGSFFPSTQPISNIHSDNTLIIMRSNQRLCAVVCCISTVSDYLPKVEHAERPELEKQPSLIQLKKVEMLELFFFNTIFLSISLHLFLK